MNFNNHNPFAAWTCIILIFTIDSLPAQNLTVAKNEVVEWSYQSSKTYENPFWDLELDLLVKDAKGNQQVVPAFWAGENTWSFRYSAPKTGIYTYTTRCSDGKNNELHGKSGKIEVIPYAGENPLYKHGTLKISPDGTHFEHLDGKPFFWLADSWWFGMSDRLKWPGEFQLLTDDRKEKGFTVIQFALGFPCDITPMDPRGQNAAGDPWTGGFETINPAYFDLADQRLEWLIRRGLLPNLMPNWGYYLEFMGVEKLKKHWRYVMARYGAYPIVWNLCGEVSLPYYLVEWTDQKIAEQRRGYTELGKFVRETDPFRRIMTVHPGPFATDFNQLEEMDLLDFIFLQPGHNGFETLPRAVSQMRFASEKFPNRPVLIGEACFEGMHGGGSGEKVQRFLFWSTFMLGAPGFSYGADAIWQFNRRNDPFGTSPTGSIWGNEPWEDAYQWPGAKMVGIGHKILQNVEWWKFRSQPEWLEEHATNENYLAPYVAGIPGEAASIYFYKKPRKGQYKLKGLAPGVAYLPVYYDPRTGEAYPMDNFQLQSGENYEVPEPPILQDWVLMIEKQ
jgi:hypothetical protein